MKDNRPETGTRLTARHRPRYPRKHSRSKSRLGRPPLARKHSTVCALRSTTGVGMNLPMTPATRMLGRCASPGWTRTLLVSRQCSPGNPHRRLHCWHSMMLKPSDWVVRACLWGMIWSGRSRRLPTVIASARALQLPLSRIVRGQRESSSR